MKKTTVALIALAAVVALVVPAAAFANVATHANPFVKGAVTPAAVSSDRSVAADVSTARTLNKPTAEATTSDETAASPNNVGACAFVDENGDGVCDNYGVAGHNPACGGYVDSNGNGTCDNYENGACPGNGAGAGNGSGQGQSGGAGSGAGNGAGQGNSQGQGGGYGAGTGAGCGQGHGCMRR